jgi:hypothetical protein
MPKVSLAQTNSLAAQIPLAPVAGEDGYDGMCVTQARLATEFLQQQRAFSVGQLGT